MNECRGVGVMEIIHFWISNRLLLKRAGKIPNLTEMIKYKVNSKLTPVREIKDVIVGLMILEDYKLIYHVLFFSDYNLPDIALHLPTIIPLPGRSPDITKAICRGPYKNELMNIITLFPVGTGSKVSPWDWKEISKNRNFIISDFPHDYILVWMDSLDWEALSANPSTPLDYIKSNKQYPWVYLAMGGRPDITVEYFFCKIYAPLMSHVSFFEISQNPKITLADIALYWNVIPFSFKGLSSNPGVTFDFMMSHFEREKDHRLYEATNKWDLDTFSKNPGFTLADIIKCITSSRWIHWNWPELLTSLSSNPNITLKFVFEHPEFKWDSRKLSANLGIPFSDIVKSIGDRKGYIKKVERYISKKEVEIEWHYGEFSSRPDIDIKFLIKSITKKHPTKYTIKDDPTKMWDMKALSCNKGIPFQFIVEYYNFLPWDHSELSSRDDINIYFLLENIDNDKWDKERLAKNPAVNLCLYHDYVKPFDISKGIGEKYHTSSNPNVNINYVIAMYIWIDFGKEGLSGNQFGLHPFLQNRELGLERSKKILEPHIPVDVLSNVFEKYVVAF